MFQSGLYTAIKIDVVNSRGSIDREALQDKLFQVTEDANNKFATV